MAASITETPAWVNKMKARFASMDVDKNGLVNDADLAILAKKLAEYRTEAEKGKEAEEHCLSALRLVWSFAVPAGGQNVDEDAFLQGMKKFVTQPDARERANKYADMVFELVDVNKDGVISLDELIKFHRASDTKVDDERTTKTFKDADTNGDGVIDKSEWEEAIAKFWLSA